MSVHRISAWIFCAFAATLAPAVNAAPCAGFIDVQGTDPFCTEITWMKNRAITLGCTANQYCPAQYVRRDQMAAFIYRLGVQNAFLHGGNAFGTTAILGTTDNAALHLNVNGTRALTLAPATNAQFGSIPNLVGGHPANNAAITCAGICVPTPEPVVGATVGGGGGVAGLSNRVSDSFGVVGGGRGNVAGNDNADHDDAAYVTIAGGVDNIASGLGSTVGGGWLNAATGAYATVPGGRDNVASGNESLAAGRFNEAQGGASIALGNRAKALRNGTFVFADNNNFDFSATSVNSFRVRATGGVEFVTEIFTTGVPTWSCITTAGSGWTCTSDRNQKQNLRRLDGRAVLEQLTAMPVFEWYPKGRNSHVKHYGPMAQDFKAAFGLGDDDKMIGTQDADGVALAAIQGLNLKLEQKIAALEAVLHDLAEELRALKNARRD